MDLSWLFTTNNSILIVVITALGIYASLILFTRISGVRSFSKISSFDFATTVAIGSVIASTILSDEPPLLQAIAALGSLFILQMSVAKLRNFPFMQKIVDNKPILLMRGTDILHDNMKSARVARKDLISKLREANVTQLSQIKAVVMETTGDISVLHHKDIDHEIDEELLEDVRLVD